MIPSHHKHVYEPRSLTQTASHGPVVSTSSPDRSVSQGQELGEESTAYKQACSVKSYECATRAEFITMASDTDKPGRKLVPAPTEALMHIAEPTTTTSTKSVVADSGNASRGRPASRNALSSLTSPPMPLVSSLEVQNHGFPERPQTPGQDAIKADTSSYEAFPAFNSWTPPSRFSLTRALSLRSPLGAQAAHGKQGKTCLTRSSTSAGSSSARGGPPSRGPETEVGRSK